MTDTGAYSDVVFGLFRLLGYRFSPRLADIGGTRFWRIDSRADYGPLNRVARQSVNLDRITPQWDDMLRTVGSLKLGRVPATGIMRTLQVGDRPTRLAQAFAEFGRIDKTIHTLTYLDDEAKRRATLIQLNQGEGRHALARAVFHGKRGELRQRYREGQENQLDGPDAGRPLKLEPWQRGLLRAVDRERCPIVAVRAASQVGKSLLALGVGLRAAVDGRGVLLASATDTSIRDMARRLDDTLEAAPVLAARFPSPRSGPGARASWRDRRLEGGGWIGFAAAGSPSQLASRTAAVAVADEVSRWPARVRSREGHPLALLRARLQDWGDAGRLIAISSPVLRNDAIGNLWADGDRRRLEYACSACGELFAFVWERVTGREKGETPTIACPACGAAHGEKARRRMLRSARWVATRAATDEDVISFGLSRLDSARATLAAVVKEWRRARLAVERGDREGLKTFRNLVLGLPGESGAADVDRLHELRRRELDVADVEQVTAGVDVQADRLVSVVLGFPAGNTGAVVLAFDVTLGDPSEDAPWDALGAALGRPFAGLPVSVVSVDAGFSTTDVRRQCQRRRWWLPVVGRGGAGKPIAKRPGPSGVCTLGKDDACQWWASRVAAGRVQLPATLSRTDIGELCAAEALTAEGGRLAWRPVEGRANHGWDAATLAIHARHFRPLTSSRRRMRLVAV